MQISYSPKFAKKYRKLSSMMRKITEEKEAIFRDNPFDHRLKTHKLNGKLDGLHAFTVNYKYRIILEFMNNDEVYFHTIGTHDIYE